MNELISQLNSLYNLFNNNANNIGQKVPYMSGKSRFWFILTFIFCILGIILWYKTPKLLYLLLALLVTLTSFSFWVVSTCSKNNSYGERLTKEIEKSQLSNSFSNKYNKIVSKIDKDYPYIITLKSKENNDSDAYYFIMCKEKVSKNDLKHLEFKRTIKTSDKNVIVEFKDSKFSLPLTYKIKNNKVQNYGLYSTKKFFEKELKEVNYPLE